MSDSLANFYQTLNAITMWTSRIIPIFQIVFGTFGNICNIIIFTRPALRTNPCSMYFLAGSINNTIAIYFTIFVRYMIEAWNLDITLTSVFICKVRQYLSSTAMALCSWFIVLASIDRFLSSSKSVRLRRLSSVSIARKVIILTIIIMLALYSTVLIIYEIAVTYGQRVCTITSINYFIYYTVEPFIMGVIPVILQSIFGALIVLNVRSMHNRVVPIADNARNERQRSNDRQLVKMHLIQVLIAILLLSPYAIQVTYYSITVTMLKRPLPMFDQAIFVFTLNLERFFATTNPVISFYLYTLTGPKFRSEFKRCIQNGLQVTLTATDLIRYVPIRVQPIVQGGNQTNTTTSQPKRTGRGNNVQPIQRQ
ncbi:unnamed protein product [Adineta ricciae]|uniref:G-protein coupled receptors family 1 profile domain-containing protein n=1 Tax=Adineta ricciae TaxID=249248 RepID=A0A815EED1_ADIRI|nr:unnamed protein product [Adineta ricciae]CAF1411726.1 unnamed protein product [Adineta ricciae]